jgi:hypothetical protein
MKPKTEIAGEKFLSGYNCAQAVLCAFADDLRTGTLLAAMIPRAGLTVWPSFVPCPRFWAADAAASIFPPPALSPRGARG